MNKIEDIFNHFLEFEEEHQLFDKKIRDFPFWSHIRFSIYNQILANSTLDKQNSNSIVSTRKKISKKNLWLGITKSPLFIFKQKEILIVNSARRIKENGKFKCIYTDFLTDKHKGKTQSIEVRNTYTYQTPAYSNNIKYTDFFELLSGAYLKVLQKQIKLDPTEKQKLENVAISFSEEFQLDSGFLVKRFTNAFLFYKSRKPFYNFILNRVKPKTLYLVSSYTHPNHLLIYLAQKKGIEVIEIQHGAIGSMHIGYNMKNKKRIWGIPDKMMLFGEYWKQNIHLPIANNKLIVNGFNQLNIDLKQYSSIKETTDKKTILVLSQWTISQQIIKFSIDLANTLDNRDYQVILRFHPSEYKKWKQNFPQLLESKVMVNQNESDNLYKNIAGANFVVGCYSTALYEAVAFKKRTFILAINDLEKSIADLYKNNFATIVDSTQDFINNFEKSSINMNNKTEEMWYSSK